MAEKTKTHEITIRVRFDKPVSAAAARRFAKNYLRRQDQWAVVEDEERDGWTRATIT